MPWLPPLLLLLASTTAAQSHPLPQVAAGRIERLALPMTAPLAARPVDVWLPPGYPRDAPYATVVMHDGQMLFDAGMTWNHQEWRVDETASDVQAKRETRPFIVVGVWNAGPARHAEYFPQKPFESLTPTDQQRYRTGRRPDGAVLFDRAVQSDAYLAWLTDTVLPEITRRYAVSADRADRVVMGSSMGGLIAMYAISEHPTVFGAAGCLSTHWPGTFEVEGNPIPPAFFAYLRASLPAAGHHRLWFDHGTETLDALYADLQRQADDIVRSKGYGDADFTSRSYPGADHSERAWAVRLAEVLRFLLPPAPPRS